MDNEKPETLDSGLHGIVVAHGLDSHEHRLTLKYLCDLELGSYFVPQIETIEFETAKKCLIAALEEVYYYGWGQGGG